MLSPMDAPDAIALGDGAQHGKPRDQPTEYGVAAVQVRLRRMGDEELAAARIGPGKRHTHGTHVVTHGIHLVPEHEARSATTIDPGNAVQDVASGYAPDSSGSVHVA